MARDVSWKSKLSTLNNENVLLKTQVDYVVQERENIKLEYQKLFNSIKATRTQHQKEHDELTEHVNQKTYAYVDVRSQNQDLLITISKLKNKLKTVDKEKNVNTKFDKSETSGTLLCVTPLPKNIAVKAKNVSKTKVNTNRSKPVTSHSIPNNEQSHKQSVESSNSVRRSQSKDTKSKNRVLKNTNDKSSSVYVRKMFSSVSIDSNKCEIMNSTVCKANKSVLNTKNVNVVNDGSNIVCVSCRKDVFLLSHEKCVARYAFSRNSSIKRALFTTPIVAKSRLSVAKTPTATNKVFSALLLSHDSSQSRTLSNYMKNKIETSRKWQKWFEYQQSFNWSPKSKTAQSQYSVNKSSDLTRLGHNLFSVGQFCDGDLEVAFRSNTCYVWNLEGDDFHTGSCVSNLYTISISEMAASSPMCLMSRATSTKSWLWHHRLSHLNFGTINQLMSKDIVDGLSKSKYCKDHLCSACEQGKRKIASLPPKLVPSMESKLELLHMDLCGPMRVVCINRKKYILVIVDDYSRYSWVYFLRTKDEAPDMINDFINQVQRNQKAQILTIHTDNGIKFENEKLRAFYVTLSIVHKTSIARTPQQNGFVE
ncbi:retrovirus-related pol polyprotein from transposon TNT 1-94 [Tanacetum coccineum]